MGFSPPFSETHSLSSGWRPWTLVANKPHGYLRPYDHNVSDGYLPSNRLNLSYEFFDNSNMIPSVASPLNLSNPFISFLVPQFGTFRMGRMRSGGAAGGYPWYLGKSPRVGVQIENIFKHQAYIYCSGTIAGRNRGSTGDIIWTDGSTTLTEVETAANYRLKDLFLHHGTIMDTPLEQESTVPVSGVRDVWFKITDEIIIPKSSVNTDITIYTQDSTTWNIITYPISETTADGQVKLTIADADVAKIQFGSFFTLSEHWLVNDPAMLHDYELRVKNGYYGTDSQIYKLPGPDYPQRPEVMGLWIGETDKTMDVEIDIGGTLTVTTLQFTVYTPYADSADRPLVSIPSSGDGTTMHKRKEDDSWGGDWAAGVAALQNIHQTSPIGSIRLILNAGASNSSQNWAAGCLRGEHCKIAGEWFEIINNPRGDTIEVKNNSVTASVQLLDILAAAGSNYVEIEEIYQQKFWLFAELYHFVEEAGVGVTPAFFGEVESVYPAAISWTGNVSSISEGSFASSPDHEDAIVVRWKTKDAEITELSDSEKILTGAETLTERFDKIINMAGEPSIPMFKKYKNWKILKVGAPQEYSEIFDFQSTRNASGGLNIKVTIRGRDVDGFSSENVAIFFDEPFETTVGTYGSSYYSYLDAMPVLSDPDNPTVLNYNLVLSGFYDMGIYEFADSVDEGSKFSILGTWLGLPKEQAFQGVWFPGLWLATVGDGGVFTSAFKNTVSDEINIIYKEDSSGYLTNRHYRKHRSSEELVRIGKPINRTAVVQGKNYVVTGGKIGLPYNVLKTENGMDFVEAFWIRFPDKQSNIDSTNYFSFNTSAQGQTETVLTIRDGVTIDNDPSVERGVIPFEYIAGSDNTQQASPPLKSYLPFYYIPSSFTNIINLASDIGIVSNDGKLNEQISLVRNGDVFAPPPTLMFDIDDLDFTAVEQLVVQPRVAQSFMEKNGNIVIPHSAKWPIGHSIGGGIPLETAADVANVIFSFNNHNMWFSPRLKKDDANTGTAEEDAAQFSLSVIKNFWLQDSLYDESSQKVLLFGYLYDMVKGKLDSQGNPLEGDVLPHRVSLVVYSISFSDMNNGSIATGYLDKITYATPNSPTTTLSYYKAPEIPLYSWQPQTLSGTATREFGFEHLNVIMGLDPADPTLNVQGLMEPSIIHNNIGKGDNISVAFDDFDRKNMTLYFENPDQEGIAALFSKDMGQRWQVVTDAPTALLISQNNLRDIDDINALIFARTGTYPSIVKNRFLFFFRGTSLYMKDLIVGGTVADTQELLDEAFETLVAEGIPPQRVSSVMTHNTLVVFFINQLNFLTALESKNEGQDWISPINW